MRQTAIPEFAPDPDSALDVLAFVLCPVAAFAPASDPEELAAVRDLLLPIKTEAVRRWARGRSARTHN